MKKYFFITLIATLTLLASCGQNDTNPQQIGSVETKKEVTTKTGDKNIKDEAKKESKENSGTTEEKMQSTMIDIFKKGKDATCTFKITSEGNTFDGIMYVKGKVLRYIMKGEVEGNKIENNILIKEGYSYSWSNMLKDGFKMKENVLENIEKSEKVSDKEIEAQEMHEKVEFNCKYSVDSIMFELPKGINFQDFSNIPQMPMGN